MSEYKIKFYRNSYNNESPVSDYIKSLDKKDRSKIEKYIEWLRLNNGHLDEPYSRHIIGKIRELRVDFAKNRHRLLYFAFINKNIILLHAFLTNTNKIPLNEVYKALNNYNDIINNSQLYEN